MAWTGVEHAYKALHEKLVREGAIVPAPDGRTMRFARDQVFASPSAAAAVVAGRTANGRHDWKIQGSGVSFGDWQVRALIKTAEREIAVRCWPLAMHVRTLSGSVPSGHVSAE